MMGDIVDKELTKELNERHFHSGEKNSENLLSTVELHPLKPLEQLS